MEIHPKHYSHVGWYLAWEVVEEKYKRSQKNYLQTASIPKQSDALYIEQHWDTTGLCKGPDYLSWVPSTLASFIITLLGTASTLWCYLPTYRSFAKFFAAKASFNSELPVSLSWFSPFKPSTGTEVSSLKLRSLECEY